MTDSLWADCSLSRLLHVHVNVWNDVSQDHTRSQHLSKGSINRYIKGHHLKCKGELATDEKIVKAVPALLFDQS